MFQTQASIATDRGEEYVRKLCKHFAHKVDATGDGPRGLVRFGFATCTMRVEGGRLYFECAAESEEGIRRAELVLSDHLQRFAWQEKLELVWEERGV